MKRKIIFCLVFVLLFLSFKEKTYAVINMADINPDCTLISSELIQLINKYLLWIRTLVPIAIIVLGTFDLLSAVVSGSEDNIKKSQSRFIKRIIMGLLIFLVPVIVNFILSTINNVWGSNYGTCGVK